MQTSRQAEMLKQKKQRLRLAAIYLDLEVKRLGIVGPEKILPVVVPANLRRIVNLPERRKRAFRDRLKERLSQAAALRASPANPSSGNEEQSSNPSQPPVLRALLARGCAICRGRCCNCGQDHAYQDATNLVSYMHRNLDNRPRHVLEAYMSCLPRRAYEESCIYHGETGCVLPHEMRSRTCLEWYCKEIWDFQRQFPLDVTKRAIYMAIEGTRLVRAEPLVAGVRDRHDSVRS